MNEQQLYLNLIFYDDILYGRKYVSFWVDPFQLESMSGKVIGKKSKDKLLIDPGGSGFNIVEINFKQIFRSIKI